VRVSERPPSIAGMAILTTQRLILREMTDADLDDMAALLGDAEVMRYCPRPKTREEAQGWINWNRALYSEHGFGRRRVISPGTISACTG
jgi:RimJ/RimL family protein N-acetyltransferase